MAVLITFNNCIGEVENINGEPMIHFRWDRPDKALDNVYIFTAAPDGSFIPKKEYYVGGFNWSASITTGVRVSCPAENNMVKTRRYYIYGVDNSQRQREKISSQDFLDNQHKMCCDVWTGSAHISYKWEKKLKGKWASYILHINSSADISDGAICYQINYSSQNDPMQYGLSKNIIAGYQRFPEIYLPEDVGEPTIVVTTGARSLIHFETRSWLSWNLDKLFVKGNR